MGKKIGIDISQLAYQSTGVANYLENLVFETLKDDSNEYILFFSSLRRKVPDKVKEAAKKKNVKLIVKKFPPSALNIMWNVLHKFPIENFIGDVDLFITSDWSEPPTKRAKKATIIYDMVVYKSPLETDSKIIKVQKKKLSWVKKESDIVFCMSNSTKNDVKEILGIEDSKLIVIHPGLTL